MALARRPRARRCLGIDAGTQSLTALVIDPLERRVVARSHVDYDSELAAFGTRGGQLPADDPRLGLAPPMLWIEALDLALTRLAGDPEADLQRVDAVAVSAQQHGTVYLNRNAQSALGALGDLDPRRPLAAQLGAILSRPVAPIWTDSTTADECAQIRTQLGGTARVCALTGSDVCERFPSPQIRRFANHEPGPWAETSSVALVSSFLTSLLIGRIAPIDHGDGSGTGLMDVRRRRWSRAAVIATSKDLRDRLPALVPSSTVVGELVAYFRKFGLGPARVVAGTGDNGSSLVGVGAVEPGELTISLGTSDTLFGIESDFVPDPGGLGHVFIAPTGDYMRLLCFRNGSLAREAVRDAYRLDWPGFGRAVEATPPGNRGRFMVPWFAPESVPRAAAGPLRFGGLTSEDVAGNCRAVLEAQFLRMRVHAARAHGGIELAGSKPVRVTGGGSRNRSILQVIADVLGRPVERAETPDGAALGAALRALHVTAGGKQTEWRDTVRGFIPVTAGRIEPRVDVSVYDQLVCDYASAERAAAQGG